MSKHHYAIELARAGNKVYFINHPDRRKKMNKGEISVLPTSYENLYEVKHRLHHPYFLKFKFRSLFNFLTRLHIRRVINKIGEYPDVVWSFDTGNTIPLKIFSKSKLRILMPVDGPFGHTDELRSAEKADVVITVTQRILDVFKGFPLPKLLINHGVADVFLEGRCAALNGKQLKVGYSGSLIRSDLDIPCFLDIINGHPEIIFEFWGEYDHKKSNIHLPEDVPGDTLAFLDTLHNLPNVILHGPVNPAELAEGLNKMDALLICYRIKNDQNHHKVLEYLGTGKVIVSNYMSSYSGEDPDLIYMVNNKEANDGLPELFNRVISKLDYYNAPELAEKRKKFARQYSYSNNLKRIQEFISTR
jgi:hypothetical protein